MAKEAGFDVRKTDWLKYQAKQTLELSDEELESVAGGNGNTSKTKGCCTDDIRTSKGGYQGCSCD